MVEGRVRLAAIFANGGRNLGRMQNASGDGGDGVRAQKKYFLNFPLHHPTPVPTGILLSPQVSLALRNQVATT